MPTDVTPLPADPVAAATQPPAPVAEGAEASPVKIPLSREALSNWQRRIEAAKKVAEEKRDEWKAWIAAYMGKVLEGAPKDHYVNVNLEYAYVEQKKATLAFQVPEVYLKPLLPGLEGAVPVFGGALNHEMGPHGAKVGTTIDEALTFVLFCGIAGSKIGYRADIRTREVPAMEPDIDPSTGQVRLDPRTGQPAQRPSMAPVRGPDGALVMGPDGQPVMHPQMRTEQYIADERYFWDHFPADQLLIAIDFEGSDFDRSPWLGMEFDLDFDTAQRELKLPKDFAGVVTERRETLTSAEQPESTAAATTKRVVGYEIWYQATVFDHEAPDPTGEKPLPGQFRRLVLIKGHNEPVQHDNSPYQWIDEQTGKLMGMEGNPIHPLTLRFLPGSAYPMSDVGVSRPTSEELNVGRTQMMQFRDRAKPMRGYDRTRLDSETKGKLERGEQMENIGFDGPVDNAIQVIALPSFPRESFDFDQVAKKDYQRLWAMDDNAAAVTDDQRRTATEVTATQAASNVRMDKERTRVLGWFTSGASKFGSLLQQFKDDTGYAEIAGPDGAKSLQAWNRQQIAGKFAYLAKPDSALRIDADVERRQSVALYNLMANDQGVKRIELVKSVLTKHGMDPAKIINDQPPPPKGPEPPKVSLTIRSEDLSPVIVDNGQLLPNPAFPILLSVLQQGGYQIPPDAIQNATMLHQQLSQRLAAQQPQAGAAGGQPEHGGATTPVTPLNKHALDRDAGPLM